MNETRPVDEKVDSESWATRCYLETMTEMGEYIDLE